MARPAVAFAKNIIKPGCVIAEVGVLLGAHAKSMCAHLSPEKIYLVDTIKQYDCTYNHEWLIGDSRSASLLAPDDLDFVYIDALHDEYSVAIDIACWYPKIKVGGIISGHDYRREQPVGRAVHRFFDKVGSEDVDWWYVKVKQEYPIAGLALVQ